MYIESIAIKNYKSFLDFGPIQFGPGFNVIVGANNVGKTALLEALSLRFISRPHRSPSTVPHVGYHPSDSSEARVVVHLEAGETKALLLDSTNGFVVNGDQQQAQSGRADEILVLMAKADSFTSVWKAYGEQWPTSNNGSLALLQPLAQGRNYGFEVDRVTANIRFNQSMSGVQYQDVLARAIHERIYKFDAERLKVSVAAFGTNKVLQANASNLAEVLNNLQSNRRRFERFNSYVRTIFPDIGWVGAPSGPGVNQVQILLWPASDTDTEREDLAIPLSESGTGIGQILAMLYVVLTAEHPQIIIIDEPQSFLNPGAVRKLIEILRQFSRHQFIVTTHSPEVIAAANPTTLTLLRKVGTETVMEQLDVKQVQHMRSILSEVGARPADVFGANQILWVEGATEELSFPHVVEHVLKRPLLGTRIIGLLQTGDLDSKDSDRVIRIYRSLSKGGSLLPPALGFVFDMELRLDSKLADIRKRFEQASIQVEFLPRRMYENFLLLPPALAHVMNSIGGFRDEQVTSDEVTTWLQSVPGNTLYFLTREAAESSNWFLYVNGAKVLANLFSQLSQGRVTYEKTTYGPMLTEWIAKNQPKALEEVGTLLAKLLDLV